MTAEVFAADSVIRRVAREGVLLGAGAVTSIMQTSHPLIARGVHAHSSFASDPIRRLRNTMEWLYAVEFGTRAEAERISAIVNAMHGRVTGPGYRANDPELQVWVTATLTGNAVLLYERVVGRLSDTELEEFYQDQKVLAAMLGCPESAHPPTYADFRAYYRDMVATLEITDEAREIAHHVLHPKMAWPARPLLPVFRLLNIGLMPEPMRRRYGWRWTRAHEMLFRALLRVIAVVYRLLPMRVRTLPRDHYLRGMRHRFARAGGAPADTAARRPVGRSRPGDQRSSID
jgi:uncharacterized protein (DUF2236 family)